MIPITTEHTYPVEYDAPEHDAAAQESSMDVDEQVGDLTLPSARASLVPIEEHVLLDDSALNSSVDDDSSFPSFARRTSILRRCV